MKNSFQFKVVLMSAFFSAFGGVSYSENLQGEYPRVFNLSNINGINGFAINGVNPGFSGGYSEDVVSGSGDINGDGFNDFVMGASLANNTTGQTYVIFGGNHRWPAMMNTTDLNGVNGFIINGVSSRDFSGYSVSIIDDINGDGIDDLMISAKLMDECDCPADSCYIIFGSKNKWPGIINLKQLDGKNGFVMIGGGFASGAGDLNGDGINDMALGVFNEGGIKKGMCAYIVFGSKAIWPAIVDLNKLDGNNGFVIECFDLDPDFVSSTQVSNLNDVNGDGIDDLLLGFFNRKTQGFVIFGKRDAWPSIFELSSLNGLNGFIMDIVDEENAYIGAKFVSGVGDINGDEINDIMTSAYQFYNDWQKPGQIYVIFGSKETWPKSINVTSFLNGDNGFIINGFARADDGFVINRAEDVNGDGIEDIIIGNKYLGYASVVFGSKEKWPAVISLDKINGENGFFIYGEVREEYCGQMVNGVGDINGDGKNDLLVKCPAANNDEGRAYIIFGI